MVPRPAGRLVQSLLAVIAVACSSEDPKDGHNLGQLGASGNAGAATGAQAGSPAGGSSQGGTAGAKAGSSGTGGSAAGASSSPTHACLAAVPILVDGVASGMVKCADGSLERSVPTTCKLVVPPPSLCDDGAGGAAGAGAGSPWQADASTPCCAAPYGTRYKAWTISIYLCSYACATDADCPTHYACACDGTGVGTCVDAECNSNEACGEDGSCRVVSRGPGGCGLVERALSCIDATDECATGADCPVGNQRGCEQRGAGKPTECVYPTGAGGCGRPILVEAKARVAELVVGGGWG